jgi:hypothetical protein
VLNSACNALPECPGIVSGKVAGFLLTPPVTAFFRNWVEMGGFLLAFTRRESH